MKKTIWFYTQQSFMLIVLRRLRNFPMLLLLAVLFVLMSFKANWVLGAPYLFWHDDFFPVGILALLAVGLLLEEWAFVAVLLDTDENNPINLSAPGQHHSRISLIAAVKDYLEIEKISETEPLPEATTVEPQGTRIVASAAAGMTDLDEPEQQQIYDTVRAIHSVGTYTLAFLFGFMAAYIYQWQNENLITFDNGLFRYGLSGIDFLGPILIGGGLMLMVYLMFLLRRAILRFSGPLTGFLEATHRGISRVPGGGRIVADWVLDEVVRGDSIFRSFHLIALVKNLITVAFVLFFSVVFWLGFRGSTNPSVALIVCVVLSGILGVYGWMVFQRRRLRFEFVIGLLLVIVLISVTQFHKLPQSVRLDIDLQAEDALPETPAAALTQVQTEAILQQVAREVWQQSLNEPVPPSPRRPDERTERELLENWKAYANKSRLDASGQTVSSTSRPLLVLVSNTGGGIKAQVWSTIVLGAIENLLSRPDNEGHFTHFPRHVRLIAGASGGMVGAGYWVATLDEEFRWQAADPGPGHVLFHRDLRLDTRPADELGQDAAGPWLTTEATVSRMARDSLSLVARQGFFNDLLGIPLRLLQFPLPTRGEALEEAFVRSGAAFDTAFRKLKPREDSGRLPTLIYTPTSANDGRRFLICNQPLEYLFYSRFSVDSIDALPEDPNIPPAHDSESTSVYSWRLNYPNSNMTLATAARLSANFPIVIDSPYLPFAQSDYRLRIMDAGYADNHGVYPLAAWLNANKEWIKANTAGVVLIQISASELPRQETGGQKAGFVPEILGFVTTSFNKTLYHSDRLLAKAAAFFNQDEHDFFKVVTFAYDGEASLSWYLNRVERLSLVYPFLSDEQADQLLSSHRVVAGKVERYAVIPQPLMTMDSQDLVESDLVVGFERFRLDDFRKSERLRARMGRQLQQLQSWWTLRQRREAESR